MTLVSSAYGLRDARDKREARAGVSRLRESFVENVEPKHGRSRLRLAISEKIRMIDTARVTAV